MGPHDGSGLCEIEDFVECSAITLKAEPNSSGRLVLYGPGRERLAIRYQLLVDAPGLARRWSRIWHRCATRVFEPSPSTGGCSGHIGPTDSSC